MKYSPFRALIKCHILSEVFSDHPNTLFCSPISLGPSPYYSNDSIVLELLVYITVLSPSYGLVKDSGGILHIVSLVLSWVWHVIGDWLLIIKWWKYGDGREMENSLKWMINSMYPKLAFSVRTDNIEMFPSHYRWESVS